VRLEGLHAAKKDDEELFLLEDRLADSVEEIQIETAAAAAAADAAADDDVATGVGEVVRWMVALSGRTVSDKGFARQLKRKFASD
jgi:hypothetical protein